MDSGFVASSGEPDLATPRNDDVDGQRIHSYDRLHGIAALAGRCPPKLLKRVLIEKRVRVGMVIKRTL
jgi:hypothetical protein